MLSAAAPAATPITAAPAVTTPAAAPAATQATVPAVTAKPADLVPGGGQVTNDTTKDSGKDSEKNSHITIRAVQSSWVLITDGHGQTIYDHVMKPGEVYKVPNKPGLSLTTGNGSGVALSLDGTDLPRLATGTSHVMRNILLDSDHLRALPQMPED